MFFELCDCLLERLVLLYGRVVCLGVYVSCLRGCVNWLRGCVNEVCLKVSGVGFGWSGL